MNSLTQTLKRVEAGDPLAAGELLPLVYEELRRLAALQMAREKPGHTLSATALVHEAYLRVTTGDDAAAPRWDCRGHFFVAAAEAMRRILVDNARRKKRLRHGGKHERIDLDPSLAAIAEPDDDLLDVHEVLDAFEERDAAAAQVVKLHYFLGLSMDETAQTLGIAPRTAYRHWSFARAWLFRRLGGSDQHGTSSTT